MRSACIVALLLSSLIAAADPIHAPLGMSLHRTSSAKPQLGMNGLCDGILRAARLGIASGKVVILQRTPDGHHETVGMNVGSARVMPAFDLNFRGASVLARVVF